MHHRLLIPVASLAMVAVAASVGLAHCQIPCGIYDDPLRFTQMEEHVATIEKSMKQIQELSAEEKPNLNQIVRWVNNKDAHADELTEIVTYYFLAQRVKPVDRSDRAAVAKYLKELTLLHEMIVHAMKAKQTIDLEHCTKLRDLIHKFEHSYLGEKARSHKHGK